MHRSRTFSIASLVGAAILLAPLTSSAQQAAATAPAASAKKWVMPRTPDGRPDMQGNWSNGSLTPLQRPTGFQRALTKEQARQLEKIRSDTVENLSKASDPNRPAPPKGGDGSTGAAGNVGGYNYVWIDAGDHVAYVNGELRSSVIVEPANGRLPALTAAAPARQPVSADQGTTRRQPSFPHCA